MNYTPIRRLYEHFWTVAMFGADEPFGRFGFERICSFDTTTRVAFRAAKPVTASHEISGSSPSGPGHPDWLKLFPATSAIHSATFTRVTK